MTSVRQNSWIVGGLKGAHNKIKKQCSPLGIFNHGRQKKAEGKQSQEDLKLGWFYWKFGCLTGPFSDAEIFELFDKGELQEDSLVALMNMPLAMLLKDPATRLDDHTMVHLKRPGLESAAMATNSAHSSVPTRNPTTSLLPESTDAKQLAKVCVADHADSEEDDDKAGGQGLDEGRVGNGNIPKGKPTTWLFPNSADVKKFAADWAAAKVSGQDQVGNGNCTKTEPRDADAPIFHLGPPTSGRTACSDQCSEPIFESEASEVDDKAKVETLEMDLAKGKRIQMAKEKFEFKWQTNKSKVPTKTRTVPSKTSAIGVNHRESQRPPSGRHPPLGHSHTERKGPSKHPRDVHQKKDSRC